MIAASPRVSNGVRVAPSKSEPSATLKALEASILETIRTLDSIHEHALPSETPDNKGLALNVHKLVRDLSQMRNASIQRHMPITANNKSDAFQLTVMPQLALEISS